MDLPGSTTDYQSGLSALSTPLYSAHVVDLLHAGTLQINSCSVITVNSIADVLDDNDGVTTLREAINQANADDGKDLIVFSPSLFSTAQTITLKLGELDITHNLDIIAPRDTLTGGDLVTVSGNNASRVFKIETGATVTLDGLIIADASGNRGNDQGGGINNGGALTLNNSIVRNNNFANGGGIYNIGTMTVNDSTISNNSVFASSTLGGGGIYNIGSITVNNSTISNNSESSQGGDGGGGIYNGGGILIVNNSNINNNRSSSTGESSGGAIFNAGGTVTVSNSTLNGNSSGGRGGRGGAIYNNASGTVTLLYSTISENAANGALARNGGGIFNDGTLTVSYSTINDNSSTPGGSVFSAAGGGIYNNGILTVSDSTISNNKAGLEGGGIYNLGTMKLVFNTITLNQAANGGGVFNNSSAVVRNTIIAGNLLSTNGINPDVSGKFSSNGYNLIGDSTGSTGFGSAGDIVGTQDNPIDPRLAPLDFYGGSTPTIALLPDSPAIDAGDPTVLDTDPTTDQRGYPRVSGSRSDIGAFEFFAP